MKLGLDIHGVIDANRPFFSQLTALLKECNEKLGHNHEVHVLTGTRKAELKPDELKDIWHTHFFSIVDHHVKNGTEVEWVDGSAWMSDYDWDRTKADYARLVGLDLMIDDSEVYHHFFTTPYAVFKPRESARLKAARHRHEQG